MKALEKLSEAMQDRTISSIMRGTGLSRPTIQAMKEKQTYVTYQNMLKVADYLKIKI